MDTFCNRFALNELCSASKNIVLIGHYNPDGDAIGSLTAFYHYLSAKGKNVTVIVPNRYPDYLSFLTRKCSTLFCYKDSRVECDSALAAADLVVCLDFNNPSRADIVQEALEASRAPKVLIDHHINPMIEFFNVVISSTEVSSTCEMLFLTLMEMPDIEGDASRLPANCITSLFTGLITDTNNFSNSVFPTTYKMASMLIAAGVDRQYIHEQVYFCYTEERMRLMGHMLLNKLTLMEDSTVAYMILTLKDKEKYNFSTGDAEGFVNLPLAIEKVQMSALLTENEDTIRVSLRSKGSLNVNILCRNYFEGGGHLNASGGQINFPINEAENYFRQSVSEYLKKAHLLY